MNNKIIDVDSFLIEQKDIDELASSILEELNRICPIEGFKYLHFKELDYGSVEFEGTEYWQYGGEESYWYTFPTEILSSLEAREKYYFEIRKKVEEDKQKQLLSIQKEKEKIEIKERETLKRLKEKYDNSIGN